MRRTDIDIHDLGPLLIKEASIQVPDELRSSHFPGVDDLDNYPDEDFALIMVDGGEMFRKFACMSPGTAWLNSMCLLGAWDRLPKTAAVLAGTNLMTVLEGTATPAPLELVEKVASAVNGDFRGEGEIVDFGGVSVVDITDLSAEKKANFLAAAGRGFKAIGGGVKNVWNATRAGGTGPMQQGTSRIGNMARQGWQQARTSVQGGAGQIGQAVGKAQGAAGSGIRGSMNAQTRGKNPANVLQRGMTAIKNTAGKAKYQGGTDLMAAGATAAGGAAAVGGVYGAGRMMGRRSAQKQAGARGTAALAGASLLAGAAGGAAVGGKRGKKKGKIEGFAAGYGSGSQKGYWKGRQQGYSLGTEHSQRAAMVRRIRELEAGQKKEAAKAGKVQKFLRDVVGKTPKEKKRFAIGAATAGTAGGVIGGVQGYRGQKKEAISQELKDRAARKAGEKMRPHFSAPKVTADSEGAFIRRQRQEGVFSAHNKAARNEYRSKPFMTGAASPRATQAIEKGMTESQKPAAKSPAAKPAAKSPAAKPVSKARPKTRTAIPKRFGRSGSGRVAGGLAGGAALGGAAYLGYKAIKGRKKEAAGFSLAGTNASTVSPQDRKRSLLTYRGWSPGEAAAMGAAGGAMAAPAVANVAPKLLKGMGKGGRLGAIAAGTTALGAGAATMHQKLWNRPKKAEAPMHLLRGQYPVENLEQIKQAEAFFNEHWSRLHPSDRRTYAVNLVKAAEAQGAPLVSEVLEKYAGDVISTEAVLHLNSRSRFVDDNGRELLIKLAESIPVADPDEFAGTLTQIDEHYGISQRWDTQIVDPYAAVLTKEASSDFRWSEGPDTVTGDQLIAASKEKRIPLTSALGEDGFQEFAKSPVTIFSSLPDDVKHVISRIAA